jgi:hypothetical protein
VNSRVGGFQLATLDRQKSKLWSSDSRALLLNVEGEKPVLSDRGNLRCIPHVEHDGARPLAAVVCKDDTIAAAGHYSYLPTKTFPNNRVELGVSVKTGTIFRQPRTKQKLSDSSAPRPMKPIRGGRIAATGFPALCSLRQGDCFTQPNMQSPGSPEAPRNAGQSSGQRLALVAARSPPCIGDRRHQNPSTSEHRTRKP